MVRSVSSFSAQIVRQYEVRITQASDPKLISNVFGVTRRTFTPQPGDTVLQKNLVRIK
ncbi:hypothetical protein [Paenibacillus koleovorans]|uniref:hypothetical protein n=1 Tax=Paenibacillus koleovorans TaxID=121608 RepID=UPI0013E3F876|nr:hypothetical protein [Paenibacillus koleovorans]